MENSATLQVGVKILIKNDQGQYLLLRRSLEKYPDTEGRWDIVGGRINLGTSLKDNLERDVFEETGLQLIGKQKIISAQDILRKTGYHVVRLTYSGYATGEIKLDESENDMYGWYSWRELVELEDVDMYFKELLNDLSLWDEEVN